MWLRNKTFGFNYPFYTRRQDERGLSVQTQLTYQGLTILKEEESLFSRLFIFFTDKFYSEGCLIKYYHFPFCFGF